MLFKKTLLLLGALFAATVLAAPVQDVSETSVDLTASTDAFNDNHLTVTVTRVDDLLTDNGEWLAERVMAVVMNFDVNDDQVLLNGVPLVLGASSVQIQAIIIANADLLNISNADDAIALAASFDTGLVTVEVEATAIQTSTPDGLPVRRIVVTEHIVEIDGQMVVQTDAGLQVLDIYDDGTVLKYNGFGLANTEQMGSGSELFGSLPGPVIGSTDMFEENGQGRRLCNGRKMRHAFDWYNRQPLLARASLAILTCAVPVAFFAMVYRAISARRRYAAIPTVSDDAKLDGVLDEKYPVSVKVQSPPAYEEKGQNEEQKPLVQ